MTPTQCILCDKEGVPFGSRPDYNKYDSADPSGVSYGVRKVYDYLKCPSCGLWWTKNVDEDYHKLYETEDYWTTHHQRRGWGVITDKERIDNDVKYSKLRIPVIKQFLNSGSALEIGSSTGTMLKELKDNGFNPVVGIEPNNMVRAQARNYSGCVMLESAKQAADDDFDLVIALDVLEHLEYPLEETRMWLDKLKINGIVFLELPDAGCLHSLNNGVNWDYVMQEHVYYYSRQHVEALFMRLGCRLIHFENPFTTDRQRLVFRKEF